jgi:hypothetical protein
VNRNTRTALQERCQALHQRMGEELSGQIEDERERLDYAFALLLRLAFAYFLQQQGLLNGDAGYLQTQLERCSHVGQPFSLYLACLTYWGFGTPLEERGSFARQMLGKVPYLSGSLFYPHPQERMGKGHLPLAVPRVSNQIFEEVLAAFGWYSWTLVEGESTEGPDGVVTPAFLGTLVEQHVENRKQTGSFYTPVEICSYMVRQTCEPLILRYYEQMTGRHCENVEQLIEGLDERDCALLLLVILPTLSVLDPACGAGDFLVVLLDQMTDIYQRIIERALSLHHPMLDSWVTDFDAAHPNREFGIRKRVASRNLFGVDIQQAPLDVTKLRLALCQLKCVGETTCEELALPNLDYSLPRGNSLVGLDRLSDEDQAILATLHPGYDELVTKKEGLVRLYREAIGNPVVLAALRAEIQDCRTVAYRSLNRVLLARMGKKTDFTLEQLLSLDPFHYAFDFSDVMMRPMWARLDGSEAQVTEVEGRLMLQFGPERERAPSESL